MTQLKAAFRGAKASRISSSFSGLGADSISVLEGVEAVHDDLNMTLGSHHWLERVGKADWLRQKFQLRPYFLAVWNVEPPVIPLKLLCIPIL